MTLPMIYVPTGAGHVSPKQAWVELRYKEIMGDLDCPACGGGGIVDHNGHEGTCVDCLGIGKVDAKEG